MSTSDMLNSLTSSGLARCPTLKGKDNYTEWEEIMRSNLRTSGCWEIVSGEEIAPPRPDPFYTSRNRPTGVRTLRQVEAEYDRRASGGISSEIPFLAVHLRDEQIQTSIRHSAGSIRYSQ